MNSFGRIFRVSIFGESHGMEVGAIVDGCPAGISIKKEDFTDSLIRRKSGAKGTTSRIEPDEIIISSGIFNNFSTGAPIQMRFANTNIKPRDYYQIRKIPRPGHADLTTKQKFDGFNDYRGGGASSGRLVLGLVASGVIAKKILANVEINATILEIGGTEDYQTLLDKAIEEADSLGGIIECKIRNLSSGLGEPFFDSVESYISHLAFSVPAVKGIEFGAGFEVAKLKGSQINDSILDQKGTTKSNNSGGLNGGISNGNDIVFRVAVKAPSSISKEQESLNIESGKLEKFEIRGRHDVCIALRFPVIVESIAAIALADLHLIRRTNNV